MTHVWKSYQSNKFIYLVFGDPNGWGYSFIFFCLLYFGFNLFGVFLLVWFPLCISSFPVILKFVLSNEITCSINGHTGEAELPTYLCLFYPYTSITSASSEQLHNIAVLWPRGSIRPEKKKQPNSQHLVWVSLCSLPCWIHTDCVG